MKHDSAGSARLSAWSFTALILTVALAGCDRAPSTSASAGPASRSVNTITVRAPDAFYEPPPNVPRRPGALLRSEPLDDVTSPPGMQGWRILYTTTVNDEMPATAVATVFAPMPMPPGPRPVITWGHGTTGLLQKCMPSLVSLPSEGIPAREQIAAAGWIVVATDYSFTEKDGPHPYIIGEGEARAALDSVRAARQMPELDLDLRTVVWGHSQGGHAALWTGIVGPRYAPEIEILGVVGIAPAADMTRIVESNVSVNKGLGPYLALAYSRFYPDVTFEQTLRPEALDAARQIVNLCGFVPPDDSKRIWELTNTFDGPALAKGTAFSNRLAQNDAFAEVAAPLLIVQGLADTVIAPSAHGYVKKRCTAGQRLEYWTFAGSDHWTIVQPGTPLEEPLIAWTKARFANEPQPKGCAREYF